MRTIDIKSDKKIEIESFCRRHFIVKLSLFGSVLKDYFSAASDIDFLVEFKEGHTPGLLALVAMEAELSGLFDGRKVDLKTPNDLSQYFRQEVLDTAEELYCEK